jgi:hypothetical protein
VLDVCEGREKLETVREEIWHKNSIESNDMRVFEAFRGEGKRRMKRDSAPLFDAGAVWKLSQVMLIVTLSASQIITVYLTALRMAL